MKDGRVFVPALLWSALALGLATTVHADNKAPKAPPQEKSNKIFAKKVVGKPADYAGSEECRDCHADQFKSFEEGPHHATLKNKDVSQQGCESCHGPAKAHVESGGEALDTLVRFKKLSAAEASAQCLDCHQGGEHGAIRLRARTREDRRLRELSYAPRIGESAAPQAQQRQPALS